MAEEVKAAVAESEGKNFIDAFIEEDIAEGGRFQGQQVHTRFPPEPNGYLHIGHCKALTIDFGTAERFGGLCNLRMDDTNPTKEDVEFVDAIKEDIHWLGFDWGDRFFYGSDYFEKDYEYAVELIKKGLAYVCDLTPEEAKEYRGDIGKPAVSPYRDRDVEENLDLFERMKNGEFPEGSRTLRAKIDLASGNFNMRDPVIYRIRYMHHHRQGDKWCIYPLYDFAHPIQDALEGITHSLCSIEFENHRPLYEWVVDNIGFEHKPKQREFARLNVTYTVMSKRYLRALVEEKLVDGWDDPRMPTLCGLRRRGFTPTSIFSFVQRSGISKALSLCDINLLDHCIREELNASAPRRMAVLDPLEVEITNLGEDETVYFDVVNNPEDPSAGTRKVPFTKHLYIERADFSDNPPPKFQRLKPDCEVRFMSAYVVKCNEVIYGEDGRPAKLLCTVDPETAGCNPPDGRKIKGTIHWVSAAHAKTAEVRLYDRLFTIEDTGAIPEDKSFKDYLNPESLTVMPNAKLEEALDGAKPGDKFQFVRMGYFCADTRNDNVFNRIVTLKDSFAKNLK